MSILAAFLWRKIKKPNICTLVFDNQTIDILSPAKVNYLAKTSFAFKRDVKTIIRQFAATIAKIARNTDEKIIIEYRIVFFVSTIPWMKAASESKFVYKFFIKEIKKLQKKFRNIELNSQLRRKLSGKALKFTKKQLRMMELVSRKKSTAFEYQLFVVALHLTQSTYDVILRRIKRRLMDTYWENSR